MIKKIRKLSKKFSYFLFLILIIISLSIVINLVKTSQEIRSSASDNPSLPPHPEGYHWELIWSDEFDGEEIDNSKWEIMGDFQRRDGWWVKEDAYLDGEGHLILRTNKNQDKYTSGAIRTKDKFEHSFGYYEARVQFPTQEGHWPAFWLFSSSVNQVDGSGKDGTEIDIMEKPSTSNLIHQALHWDGYEQDHQFDSKPEIPLNESLDNWHIAGLDWRQDKYTFYLDNEITWVTSAGGVSQVPEYIKLTEEIGSWGGDINQADLPDYFKVDYVRVYDLVENTIPSTPTPTPKTSPSPMPTPTPEISPACVLNFSVSGAGCKELTGGEDVQFGETEEFSCTKSFSKSEAVGFFRALIDGSLYKESGELEFGNLDKVKWNLLLDKEGDWLVQCQICTDSTKNYCTEWGQAN